jgi:hypothetical protein
MKAKAKDKTTRGRKSRAPGKSAPKASKVKDVDDKDLEQISGGLRTNTSMIKMW